MSDSVRPHRQQPTRLPCPWDSPGKNTGVGCRFLLQCMKVKSESEVTQSCPTLHDPVDCSLPGSSIHGIFQARVLEWGAIAFSRPYLELTLNKSFSFFLSLYIKRGLFRRKLLPQLLSQYVHVWRNTFDCLSKMSKWVIFSNKNKFFV